MTRQARLLEGLAKQELEGGVARLCSVELCSELYKSLLHADWVSLWNIYRRPYVDDLVKPPQDTISFCLDLFKGGLDKGG